MNHPRILALVLVSVAAGACSSAAPQPSERRGEVKSALADTISCTYTVIEQCAKVPCGPPVILSQVIEPDVHVQRLADRITKQCKACVTDADCVGVPPLPGGPRCDSNHRCSPPISYPTPCHQWTEGQLEFQSSLAHMVMGTGVFTTDPQPRVVGLGVTADATVTDEHPNENQGAAPTIRLGEESFGLVRVEQPALTTSTGVTAAGLTLSIASNGNHWGPNGRRIAIHRLKRSWVEESTTWNCPAGSDPANSSRDCSVRWKMDADPGSQAPYVGTATATALITNDQTGDVTFDVTADALFFSAHPEQNFGWLIKNVGEDASGNVELWSREGDVPPSLTIVSPPDPLGPWGPYYTGTIPPVNHNGFGFPDPPSPIARGTVINGRFTIDYLAAGRQYAGHNVPGTAIHAYNDVRLTCSGSTAITPLP